MSNLIVGGSSGLGKEIAYEFAKKSKDIVLVSRDIKDLNILKSDIQIKYNIDVKIFQLDFTKPDEVVKFISENHKLLEKLDGALFPIGMMKEHDTIENFEKNFLSLLSANFYCIAFFISRIIKIFENRNKGFIVGFGSISGTIGRDVNLAYSCAKSALENFFEGLIISNLKNNIKIQFYILGYLDTNLSSGKKLLLPKGSPKNLAKIVFKNLNKKSFKNYYPGWWKIIDLIIKMIPFFILKNVIKHLK